MRAPAVLYVNCNEATVQCTGATVQCTGVTVQCTGATLQCTGATVQSTLQVALCLEAGQQLLVACYCWDLWHQGGLGAPKIQSWGRVWANGRIWFNKSAETVRLIRWWSLTTEKITTLQVNELESTQKYDRADTGKTKEGHWADNIPEMQLCKGSQTAK